MTSPQRQSQNEFVVWIYATSLGSINTYYAAVPKRGRIKRILVAFITTHTGGPDSVVTIERNGTSIGRTFTIGTFTAPEVVTFPLTPFAGSGQVITEFDKGDVLILNSGGQGSGGEAYVAIVMEELAENRP